MIILALLILTTPLDRATFTYANGETAVFWIEDCNETAAQINATAKWPKVSCG